MTEPAVRVAGHFGEWLQGRHGPEGPVALITVACPVLAVTAPGGMQPPFTPESLGRFAARLNLSEPLPETDRNFPLGTGCGGSTATLIAMARAAGFAGSPEALAEACTAIEGASDPLMFPDPDQLLWASREARVLRYLPPPPACEIIGGFWGDPVRTAPEDDRFDDIADLASDWEQAAGSGDLTRAASLASDSARRCTSLRGPDDPMEDLARDLGAAGWLRAHTGSARGLIFAPGRVPDTAAEALKEAGLTGVMRFRTGTP